MKFIRSKKVIAIFLIIVAVIVEVTTAILYHFYNTALIFPEVLYYTTQIVSSIFVTSGVIIAVWQYYLSSKSAKTDLEVIQVQRAIDLSEYYKDNILRYMPAIVYIYNRTGISEIVKKIDLESLEHFDEAEMQKLLTKEEILKLDELTKTDNFINVFMNANYIYGLGFQPYVLKNIPHPFSCSDDDVCEIVPDKEAIGAFVGNLFCDVLNNMEFFAMHFSHCTADESVVYQSLHQTYLSIVHLLYFKIARINKASATKYYTNVIWLYKKWINRKKEQDNNFLSGIRNLTTSGTIIQK